MLEEIMPGKITMQGLTFTAITATEECTLPVTNHTNCRVAHCLINVVYLTACVFIRS